ncbi:protein of unknown function [Agrobacterium pusense]|uniref:Uncharacterized protein n=1 Tax=Agrobacterium pusense TaxID=648995 RepID=U4PZV5_9HYPH|nr:protein of unknown function [Agrobacterium pusense]
MKQSGTKVAPGLFAQSVPDTTWSMKALEALYADKNSSVSAAVEHGALSCSSRGRVLRWKAIGSEAR